jgi:putative transposase
MVIYRDREDYEAFSRMLGSTIDKFSWLLIAYCLMPTHYHAVLEVPRIEDLSNGMHRLNGSYAQYFNRRHERSGALFQGRFLAKVVETEEYLEQLCGYVAFNPVRAGHCARPADWPWRWSRYAL